MSKKVKKIASVATFGLSDAAYKLAVDPINAALGLGSAALGVGGDSMSSDTGASAPSAIPTAQDPEAMAAREDQKRRQAAAAGLSANVLTGAGGLKTQANTGLKSLLGS
ncbi:MAG: hypothetical protein ACRCTL_11935 [Pseudomonas sp.]